MKSPKCAAPAAFRCRTLATVLLVAIITHVALQAQPAMRYVGRVGFSDFKHTRVDGFQDSWYVSMPGPGFAVGQSQRFYGVPVPGFGPLEDLSAWMTFALGGTRSIGLYDSVHTSGSGYHTSRVLKVTRGGWAMGHSLRYGGYHYSRGQSAWVADWWGGTRRVGLFYHDPTPPLADGSRINHVVDVNAVGQSIGYAPTTYSQYAWAAEADGTTRRIGLYGPDYTEPYVGPINTPVAINSQGAVIGHTIYATPSHTGNQAAWLHLAGNTQPIVLGMQGPDYVDAEGRVLNRALAINDTGHVVGASASAADDPYEVLWLRKADGTQVTLSERSSDTGVFLTQSGLVAGWTSSPPTSYAWIYDIAQDEFLGVGGAGASISKLTESGFAIGSRWNYRARYVWIWSREGGGTIGFYTPEYEKFGGAFTSYVVDVSEDGRAIGYSDRGGNTTFGTTAWIANASGHTHAIGLLDPVHTAANGRQESYPTAITHTRFVAGYSVRYNGDATADGRTAWIYNGQKNAYARVALSVRPSDGYAYSEVKHLTPNGIAVGTYTRFDDAGVYQGERAFLWVTGRGVFDLGDAMDIDPDTADWARLTEALVSNQVGSILTHGVPAEHPLSRGVFRVEIRQPPATVPDN